MRGNKAWGVFGAIVALSYYGLQYWKSKSADTNNNGPGDEKKGLTQKDNTKPTAVREIDAESIKRKPTVKIVTEATAKDRENDAHNSSSREANQTESAEATTKKVQDDHELRSFHKGNSKHIRRGLPNSRARSPLARLTVKQNTKRFSSASPDGSEPLLGVSIEGLKAMLDVLLTKSLATLEINGFLNAEVAPRCVSLRDQTVVVRSHVHNSGHDRYVEHCTSIKLDDTGEELPLKLWGKNRLSDADRNRIFGAESYAELTCAKEHLGTATHCVIYRSNQSMFDVVSALEDFVESHQFQDRSGVFFFIGPLCRSPRLGGMWLGDERSRSLAPICILNHWNPSNGKFFDRLFATAASMRSMASNDLQLAHTPEAKRQFIKVLESDPNGSPLLNAIVETAEIFKDFGGYEESERKGKQDQHVFHRLKYWHGVTPEAHKDTVDELARSVNSILRGNSIEHLQYRVADSIRSSYMRLSTLIFVQLNKKSNEGNLRRLRVGRCVLMFRQVIGQPKRAIEFAEALVHSFDCYSSCCAEHGVNGRLSKLYWRDGCELCEMQVKIKMDLCKLLLREDPEDMSNNMKRSEQKQVELFGKLFVSWRGVPVRLLEEFRRQVGGKECRELSVSDPSGETAYLSTEAVAKRLLKKPGSIWDKERKCVVALKPFATDPDLKAPTSFMSHSWGSNFDGLLQAAASHRNKCLAARQPEPIFWNDVLCMNQFALKYAFLLDPLEEEMVSCKELVMCLPAWDRPEPLLRLWCLLEIMTAMRLGIPVRVAMTKEQRHRFREQASVDDVQRIVKRIDARVASAFDSNDVKRLRQRMEDSVGMDTLTIFCRMVITNALLQVRAGSESSQKAAYSFAHDQLVHALHEMCESARFQNNPLKRFQLRRSLVLFLINQVKISDSQFEEYYKAVHLARLLFGNESNETKRLQTAIESLPHPLRRRAERAISIDRTPPTILRKLSRFSNSNFELETPLVTPGDTGEEVDKN